MYFSFSIESLESPQARPIELESLEVEAHVSLFLKCKVDNDFSFKLLVEEMI